MLSNTDRHFLICLLFPIAALAGQPSAVDPVEAPLRDLNLGQLNFLHTTDTHGWHAGHLLEPSFSADYGDYISFATRLREKIEADGNDLLLVDTGDRVEGNGLYDASDPKGKYLYDIIAEQQIDVIASGNHELYKQRTSENEYNILVPKFRDNYVASNIDIRDPKTGKMVPLAPRFRKFTTKKQGIRITAFGFLFDFTWNYNNTVVKEVEAAIKEDWFKEAIRETDVDLFLVIGHAPLRGKEFDAIFKAIRDVQWDTPIQFFGGHLHVRDYKKYDAKAVGLASGRFMETIGFQSISGLSTGDKQDLKSQGSLTFSRRYIDGNLLSYHHHTGLNESTFPTPHGLNVSKQIKAAREKLSLDTTFGCSIRDLWMSRAKYPSNSSIYSWLENEVLPDIISNPSRKDKSRIAVINTGGIRFDILKGPFTRDSTFIVSPFTNKFRYIKDVPYEKAIKVLPILNSGPPILQQVGHMNDWNILAPAEQRHFTEDIVVEDSASFEHSGQQVPLGGDKTSLTPGYTTKDDDGDDGDDTIHAPISFYKVPNVVQSVIHAPSSSGDPKVVDFVYIDFIQPWILLALKFVGLEYTEAETGEYIPDTDLTDLLADWVKENWKANC